MALELEFSRRSTAQLHRILTFYDKRNGSDTYSRKLLKELMDALLRVAQMPTASSPSTRADVRFIYVIGYTVVFCYNTKKLTMLSIRSSLQKPLTLYQKA